MTSSVELRARFAHFATVYGYKLRIYQFRHVLAPLAQLGYRVIAPDYRGAGQTSRPPNGYQKSFMASDIRNLLEYLEISELINLVGHDIGGMVAVAFAQQYPSKLKL
ncbi:alpha/beta-hydrolase [Meira miltonrushii]|uniref:Alpha/beta-hydrolase n=1 Tax=Meira miltonrushii TaxID=1280837 RepID=A0A316VLX0_9BASI|nr:alpha/beta-hydrolase [Meira miltonrushii]PWN38566.1 alpha/beta-hydrolase [Meira miltonrushii]